MRVRPLASLASLATRGACAIALAGGLAGCTYPEFAFGASEADAEPEATISDDASIDADVDAPAPEGCTGIVAEFCEDWDDATNAQAGFTRANVSEKGSIALDPLSGRSASNALLAAAAPDPGAPVVVANVDRPFVAASPETPMRIDAWLNLEHATYPSADGSAFLLKLQRAGGSGDGVTLSIDSAGLYVDRIGLTYAQFRLPAKPKEGAWFHVRLDVVLHTTKGSVVAWVDDMTTPVLSISSISTAKGDGTGRQLLVGLYAQDATDVFRVRYDDVSLAFR